MLDKKRINFLHLFKKYSAFQSKPWTMPHNLKRCQALFGGAKVAPFVPFRMSFPKLTKRLAGGADLESDLGPEPNVPDILESDLGPEPDVPDILESDLGPEPDVPDVPDILAIHETDQLAPESSESGANSSKSNVDDASIAEPSASGANPNDMSAIHETDQLAPESSKSGADLEFATPATELGPTIGTPEAAPLPIRHIHTGDGDQGLEISLPGRSTPVYYFPATCGYAARRWFYVDPSDADYPTTVLDGHSLRSSSSSTSSDLIYSRGPDQILEKLGAHIRGETPLVPTDRFFTNVPFQSYSVDGFPGLSTTNWATHVRQYVHFASHSAQSPLETPYLYLPVAANPDQDQNDAQLRQVPGHDLIGCLIDLQSLEPTSFGRQRRARVFVTADRLASFAKVQDQLQNLANIDTSAARYKIYAALYRRQTSPMLPAPSLDRADVQDRYVYTMGQSAQPIAASQNRATLYLHQLWKAHQAAPPMLPATGLETVLRQADSHTCAFVKMFLSTGSILAAPLPNYYGSTLRMLATRRSIDCLRHLATRSFHPDLDADIKAVVDDGCPVNTNLIALTSRVTAEMKKHRSDHESAKLQGGDVTTERMNKAARAINKLNGTVGILIREAQDKLLGTPIGILPFKDPDYQHLNMTIQSLEQRKVRLDSMKRKVSTMAGAASIAIFGLAQGLKFGPARGLKLMAKYGATGAALGFGAHAGIGNPAANLAISTAIATIGAELGSLTGYGASAALVFGLGSHASHILASGDYPSIYNPVSAVSGLNLGLSGLNVVGSVVFNSPGWFSPYPIAPSILTWYMHSDVNMTNVYDDIMTYLNATESGAGTGDDDAGNGGAGNGGAAESGAGNGGAGNGGAAESGAGNGGAAESGAGNGGAAESGAGNGGAGNDGAAESGDGNGDDPVILECTNLMALDWVSDDLLCLYDDGTGSWSSTKYKYWRYAKTMDVSVAPNTTAALLTDIMPSISQSDINAYMTTLAIVDPKSAGNLAEGRMTEDSAKEIREINIPTEVNDEQREMAEQIIAEIVTNIISVSIGAEISSNIKRTWINEIQKITEVIESNANWVPHKLAIAALANVYTGESAFTGYILYILKQLDMTVGGIKIYHNTARLFKDAFPDWNIPDIDDTATPEEFATLALTAVTGGSDKIITLNIWLQKYTPILEAFHDNVTWTGLATFHNAVQDKYHEIITSNINPISGGGWGKKFARVLNGWTILAAGMSQALGDVTFNESSVLGRGGSARVRSKYGQLSPDSINTAHAQQSVFDAHSMAVQSGVAATLLGAGVLLGRHMRAQKTQAIGEDDATAGDDRTALIRAIEADSESKPVLRSFWSTPADKNKVSDPEPLLNWNMFLYFLRHSNPTKAPFIADGISRHTTTLYVLYTDNPSDQLPRYIRTQALKRADIPTTDGKYHDHDVFNATFKFIAERCITDTSGNKAYLARYELQVDLLDDKYSEKIGALRDAIRKSANEPLQPCVTSGTLVEAYESLSGQ
jgi:hypothetical protein